MTFIVYRPQIGTIELKATKLVKFDFSGIDLTAFAMVHLRHIGLSSHIMVACLVNIINIISGTAKLNHNLIDWFSNLAKKRLNIADTFVFCRTPE